MKIAAIACWQGTEVGAALRETLSTPPRRAGHFAELALLGAVQCAKELTLPADTAVIIASESGNRQQAEALVREVIVERTAPMPFAFIASQSGAACQTIARQLGFQGPAICISSTHAALERALMIAHEFLKQGDASAALVGWVEEAQASGSDAISHWFAVGNFVTTNRAEIAVGADLTAEQAAVRARDVSALDIDADAAVFMQTQTPVDEPTMARHITESWNAGRSYSRVRALDNGRYLTLSLRR